MEILTSLLAEKLIPAIVSSANSSTNLQDRRESILQCLKEATQSDVGVWAWGRGNHRQQSIATVAFINFGFTPESLGIFLKGAFEPTICHAWRTRILTKMGEDSQSTFSRTDLYSSEEWETDPFRGYLNQIRLNEWIHGLNYSTPDTWSNLFVARNEGAPPYRDADRELMRIAMKSVSWLHGSLEETVPPEAFEGLSPRQKTVLLMLLDGSTRKGIAASLQIGEDTVGDHIKGIYKHFGVNSVSELSAMFLRGHQ